LLSADMFSESNFSYYWVDRWGWECFT